MKKDSISLIIPTKCLEFCCTGLTLMVRYFVNLLKLLTFITILLYHYEYSRHNKLVSVVFDSFPKISRRYFIFRGNVVIELQLQLYTIITITMIAIRKYEVSLFLLLMEQPGSW